MSDPFRTQISGRCLSVARAACPDPGLPLPEIPRVPAARRFHVWSNGRPRPSTAQLKQEKAGAQALAARHDSAIELLSTYIFTVEV